MIKNKNHIVRNNYFVCICIFILYCILNTFEARNSSQPLSLFFNYYNGFLFFWIIIVSYIYWIFSNLIFYTNELIQIRYENSSIKYEAIVKEIFMASLKFIVPLWTVLPLIAIFSNTIQDILYIGLIPTIIGLINISLGILLIGTFLIIPVLIYKTQKQLLCGFSIIFLILAFDCMNTMGFIRLKIDFLYIHFLSIQLYIKSRSFDSLLQSTGLLLFLCLVSIIISTMIAKKCSIRSYLVKIASLFEFNKLIIPAIIGIAYSLLFSKMFSSTESFILKIFAGLSLNNYVSAMEILIFILPIFIHLYLLTGYFRNDFNSASAYVFTRSKNKHEWYIIKLINLTLYSILFWMIMWSCSVIMSALQGIPIISFESLVLLFFSMLVVVAINNLIMLLIANIIAIKSKEVIAIVTVFILQLSYPFIINLLWSSNSNSYLMFSPLSLGLYFLHDIPDAMKYDPALFNRNIGGFTIAVSLALSLIYLAVTIYIGKKTISKIEIY